MAEPAPTRVWPRPWLATLLNVVPGLGYLYLAQVTLMIGLWIRLGLGLVVVGLLPGGPWGAPAPTPLLALAVQAVQVLAVLYAAWFYGASFVRGYALASTFQQLRQAVPPDTALNPNDCAKIVTAHHQMSIPTSRGTAAHTPTTSRTGDTARDFAPQLAADLATLSSLRTTIAAAAAAAGTTTACPACGKQLDPILTFCPWCATRLDEATRRLTTEWC